MSLDLNKYPCLSTLPQLFLMNVVDLHLLGDGTTAYVFQVTLTDGSSWAVKVPRNHKEWRLKALDFEKSVSDSLNTDPAHPGNSHV